MLWPGSYLSNAFLVPLINSVVFEHWTLQAHGFTADRVAASAQPHWFVSTLARIDQHVTVLDCEIVSLKSRTLLRPKNSQRDDGTQDGEKHSCKRHKLLDLCGGRTHVRLLLTIFSCGLASMVR